MTIEVRVVESGKVVALYGAALVRDYVASGQAEVDAAVAAGEASLQAIADSVEGSETAVAASASAAEAARDAAQTAETNAANSANAASTSAGQASASATAAQTAESGAEAAEAGVIAAISGAGGALGTVTLEAASRALLANLDTSLGLSAILTESGREGTFVFDDSDLSAEVTEDPAQGKYVAFSSDTTGASGAWVRKAERITPQQVGALGAGTDHTAFQRALDLAAYESRNNRELVVSLNRPFTGTSLIYIPPRIIIEGTHEEAGYKNIATSGHFARQSFSLGTIGHPAFYPLNASPAGGDNGAGGTNAEGDLYDQHLTFHACASASAGHLLVCSTPANAGNYAAGDTVFVRSAEYYYGSNGQVPHFGVFNEIISADAATGEIVLLFPLPIDLASPYIANVTEPIDLTTGVTMVDFLGNRTSYCLNRTRIYGISVAAEDDYNVFSAHSGLLNCDFHFRTVKGKTGMYFNGLSYTQIRADHVDVTDKWLDLAGAGAGSRIEIGTISYRETAGVSDGGDCGAINEGNYGQRVRVQTAVLEGWNYASVPFVNMRAAGGSRVEVDHISASDAAGFLGAFTNSERLADIDVGETQHTSDRNTIIFRHAVHGSSLQRVFNCSNAGGELTNCIMEAYTEGSVTTAAVTLAGDNMTVLGRYASKGVTFSGATNYHIDAQFDNGVVDKGNVVGGGGAATWTPNLTEGLGQKKSYSGAASFTVNAATGGEAGQRFTLRITSGNISTITPAFASNYQMNGLTLLSLATGEYSEFEFEIGGTAANVFGLVSATQKMT